MKTKKKVKHSRSLSKRRGDGSFRKIEQAPDVLNQRSLSVHFQPPQECAAHRNQRWVHLPLTIYEALREFSCLFPCRSSCFSTNEKEKEEKINGSKCAFARWLVALQNGEAEKNRDIEFVVANNGEEEEKERIEEMKSRMRSSRRHVFEDIEFKDIETNVKKKELGVREEEEKARVSICVPPKNALLLMRCRSDPMKMADLTNKFWESPARKVNNEKEEIGENEQVEKELADAEKFELNNELEVIDKGCEETEETSDSVNLVENEEISESVEIMEMEIASSKDEEKLKRIELEPETEQEDEEEKNSSESREDTSEATEEEDETFNSTINKEIEETLLSGHIDEDEEEEIATKSDGEIAATEKNEVEKGDIIKSVLPDCLLMMMYEPKLSMEVSKETWVHSTDFILPEREKQAKSVKKRISIESKPPHPASDNRSDQQLLVPPRSSCCLPAAGVPPMSMATMIEQKLVKAMAYEPFVLTRCKSEPMRTAAAKVAPESCFWKNRKFEPHRPATYGVGF
uniref:Glutamic acid-rich protein-like n=1 Tax=Nicotiana tabacum TaxID=4097 RepID=A0A1S4DG57_TOBAC|nr:PREDICTED: glutamic acid-rich protein-like [Nicotiana tabacum]